MAVVTSPTPAGSRLGLMREFGRVDWLGVLALGMVGVIVAVALLGSVIAPHDPNANDLLGRLDPPAWAGGTWEHVLGTDQLGRDVLSRLLVGTRLTLVVGVVTAALSVLVGAGLGVIAGYRGGRVDRLIMRWTDIQMGFPALLLILLILVSLGSGTVTMILALGLNGWMIFARLIRAEVVRIKHEPYVEAARVTGTSGLTVLRSHILPQIRNRLITVYLMEIPRIILAAASLEFIGFGTQPPHVTWGLIIGDGRSILSVAPWTSLFAGFAIIVTIFSLYVSASWLEPRIDPLRRRARRSG
jgi:peptide/nickel transport system permease protein